MGSAVRLLTFSEGVSTGAPLLSKIDSTGFKPFADDASYLTAKGSAVGAGDAYFNTTSKLVRYYDGTAWINVLLAPSTTTQTLGAGATIALSAGVMFHVVFVVGSGAVTLSTTPFGTTPFADGTVIKVVGTSDANTVKFAHNDSAGGCILNGPCVLEKFMITEFVYSVTLSRFIQCSRNF